ncbi:glmZ(sRNA)-inactivating NTPase [Exiguobacterium sp. Leaf187]|uniref:GlmZ(SRNA)-inactivating NTPase n=1 Tax=Exiguobacterium indicum TaxID=296995 RepID=A0AAW3MFC6_9BACL|nr:MULTISPECIES: RNase adapter RapZ [Exiguobacterium]KQS19841.1 glmZ(sRNA)-inactivating NTPase [Exiguobacterium sp. Leaf187]KTR27432.1 glmZ(sRNA)-inactivating NTPase [Exiguobacterium indicum]MCQ4089361.1 RNase adapter RapZ [Exiguobacterium sp. LL15]NTY10448.1 RNase adapter RapZ [Exiguobacterium sp. JMULE1]
MEQNQPQLVIITGMSGAGKTVAMNSFEDLGYFCVDNLPPTLLPQLIEVIGQVRPKIAVAIDTRARDFIDSFFVVYEDLKKTNLQTRMLYLDARNDVLVRRYKESRRSHPLAPTDSPLIGIERERTLLEGFRDKAQMLIDTSDIKPLALKERLLKEFTTGERIPFTVNVMSFGFKHGLPLDADLVFDLRFLPNPFYIPELRPKTGLDEEVASYVMQWPEAKLFYKKLVDLLEFLIPQYEREGKSQLVIALGCTGGKHRSITFAEAISKEFATQYHIETNHRDYVHAKEEK